MPHPLRLLTAAAAAAVAAGVPLHGSACPSGYAIRGHCVPVGQSPLDFYLALPDPHYGYKGPIQTFDMGDGATAYVLNMTSQQWLTEDVFKQGSPSRSIWWHQLTVVIPRNISASRPTSWLYLTGGSNHGADTSPVSKTNSELIAAARMARTAGTPAALLMQIPNEPVRFATEIPHSPGKYDGGRSEDGIIAYTWNHFVLSDPHSPEWLLRLPMTKAVSRAMDTITDFVSKRAGVEVADFVVSGGSKRGWTTWTAGVVEPRCKAIVPIVMDMLNQTLGVRRHFQSLGGFTFEYDDYIEAGMVGDVIDTPAYQQMLDIVDPYSYFKPGSPWPSGMFRALPKMVVDGGNDEFFLPDDNHYWWDELPGEKHLLHIPNADHPLNWWPLPGNGTRTFEDAGVAFYAAVVAGARRPTFTWTISADASEIIAANFTEPPVSVIVWSATTKDGYRDWRLQTCRGHAPAPGNCTGSKDVVHHRVPYKAFAAEPVRDGAWRAAAPEVPRGQWAAFFLSAEFRGGFRFTTQISVFPDVLPYKYCSGEECNRRV